jgi:predicted nucleic acid-binding protein
VIELADTSVWARKAHPEIRDWFIGAVEAGDIAACDMVALELLHSGRTPTEFAAIEMGLAALPRAEMGTAVWGRACEVFRDLGAGPGMPQRSVKHADLLIAAAAEQAGMTILHYDADYDVIAGVTGQPTRWVAPRGSL